MALSLLLRNASTKLTGYTGPVLTQQALRLSSSTLQNASKIRMVQPLQPIVANTFSAPKPVLIKNEYSTSPVPKAIGANTSLWIAERVVAAGLVAIVPLAIAFPCKPLDILMAVTLVAHTYWGFEAIISEYVRVLLFGSIVPKVAHALLIALMITTLGGLFYLIFDDIGFAGAIRRLWNIKPKQATN